jgi:hypothetical protein
MLAYNGKVVSIHMFDLKNYMMELYEIGMDRIYAKSWQVTPILLLFSQICTLKIKFNFTDLIGNG